MNIIPFLLSITAGEPVIQPIQPPPPPIVAPAPKPKPKQEPYLNCFFTKDNVYKCVP